MIGKIICFFKGHEYRVKQSFGRKSRRVVCPTCNADWGMNDNAGALINWDEELEKMYEDMGYVVEGPKFKKD